MTPFPTKSKRNCPSLFKATLTFSYVQRSFLSCPLTVYPLCVGMHVYCVCWHFHCRWLPVKVRSLPRLRNARQRRLKKNMVWVLQRRLSVCPQALREKLTEAKLKGRKTSQKEGVTCQGLSGQSLSTCAWENLVPMEMSHCLVHTNSPCDGPSYFSLFFLYIFALRFRNI